MDHPAATPVFLKSFREAFISAIPPHHHHQIQWVLMYHPSQDWQKNGGSRGWACRDAVLEAPTSPSPV